MATLHLRLGNDAPWWSAGDIEIPVQIDINGKVIFPVAVTLANRCKLANIQLAAGAADVVFTLSFSKQDAEGQRVITGTVKTGTLSTADDSKSLADLYAEAIPTDADEGHLSIDKEARILNSSSTVATANRLALMHTLPAGGLYPLTQLF